MNADRLTEIRHIAPTAGPLGQEAINELLAENELFRRVAVDLFGECQRLKGLRAGAYERIDQLELNWGNLVGPLVEALGDEDLSGEEPSLIIKAVRELVAERDHLRDSLSALEVHAEELTAEMEELRRNGAGTVQQLRAELDYYSNCYDAARETLNEVTAERDRLRAELADLHNVEADLRAERDALRGYRDRLGERVLDHIQRTSLTRKDCCGAPWDANHRPDCEHSGPTPCGSCGKTHPYEYCEEAK